MGSVRCNITPHLCYKAFLYQQTHHIVRSGPIYLLVLKCLLLSMEDHPCQSIFPTHTTLASFGSLFAFEVIRVLGPRYYFHT